jgi:nitroreductase
MSAISGIIRNRHSSRGGFDPQKPVAREDLQEILEAARWAPTPNNMQNFEIVVVDDPQLLKRICDIPDDLPERYLRENFEMLRFGEKELRARRSGMLAADYPDNWTDPDAWNPPSNISAQLTHLGMTLDQHQTLLLVVYDRTRRAPGSEHDVLGHMSLGCVMENMWLTSEAMGVGMQVLTVFADGQLEQALKAILMLPPELGVGFACSLGYPLVAASNYVRVRRDLGEFVHHNRFGSTDWRWTLADATV